MFIHTSHQLIEDGGLVYRHRNGSCVYVEGKLKVNKWESKDGSKKQRYFVSGDVVRFLPNSKKDSPAIENPEPSVSISNIVNEEDIPF